VYPRSEAIRLSRHALRLRGDFVGAHRRLTAAAIAGMDDVAKAAPDALRRAQPTISLAWIESQMPFEHEVEREHYLSALRRAGLG
jgi:hypothetical protein